MLFIIGFHVLPNASAGVYVNDAPYKFSINYPHGWIVENEGGIESLVGISDKYDWTTNIHVYYFEDAGEQLSDNEEIDWMFTGLEERCESDSFAALCFAL